MHYRSDRSIRVERAEGREDGAIQGDPAPMTVHSNELSIDISTRTPAEIEIALKDAEHRTRALVELQLRDDDEVIPILRKYVDDPDLRLHAIRTLGAKGEEQDLETMRDATRDPDRPDELLPLPRRSRRGRPDCGAGPGGRRILPGQPKELRGVP